jgi:hypothetical protein
MSRRRPILLAIASTAMAFAVLVPFFRGQLAPAGQRGSAPTAPQAKSQPAAAKAQVFAGKVVSLETQAGKSAERRLALVGDDGTKHPLVADEVSRMFRLYPQLRDRPVKVTGRLAPGSKDLKVEFVQTVKDGKLLTVDFWCEVCQISHQQPMPCVCCGDELELRERLSP